MQNVKRENQEIFCESGLFWVEPKRFPQQRYCNRYARRADGRIQIELNGGRVAVISSEDFDRVSAYHWSLRPSRYTDYVARYEVREQVVHGIQLHRFLLNPGLNLFVDHQDGNGLNNTRENLRTCTPGQNQANSAAKGGRRYKGAYPAKGKGFTAIIKKNYKAIYLGTFPTEIEAARAYDQKALEIHGEFARLNFPR
jgi:hypothetical protein